MFNKKLLGAGLMLSCALCSNAEAKLYKWVDSGGTTHYGETIPPEYANRDATQFNEKGRAVKHIERLTPEERRAKKQDDIDSKTAEKAVIETKRRDRALLSTFSNEAEIDLSRDRGLQQVEARINSFTTLLKSAQDSLASLRKEQDDLVKQNRPIPKSLLEDIEQGKERISKLEGDLGQSQQESADVKARFEADKLRFRELKGTSSTAP